MDTLPGYDAWKTHDPRLDKDYFCKDCLYYDEYEAYCSVLEHKVFPEDICDDWEDAYDASY